MATNIKITTKVVTSLPTERPLVTGEVYKVKQPNGDILTYIVDSSGEPVFERGIDNDEQSRLDQLTQTQVTKLVGLDSQSALDAKFQDQKDYTDSRVAQTVAETIPVSGTVLPRGANIPSYITTVGKAELYGGTGGTTYTNTGRPAPDDQFVVEEGKVATGFYNKSTDNWSLGSSVPLPAVPVENTSGSSESKAISQKYATDTRNAVNSLDPYGINLSGINNWQEDIVILPSAASDRFTSGDGFVNASSVSVSKVDSSSIGFDYEGKSAKVSIGNTLFFYYFIDAKRFYENPAFDGTNIYVRMELISPVTKSIVGRGVRVTGTTTETTLPTQTINLVANTPKTVDFTFNLLGGSEKDNVRGIEIRFFPLDNSNWNGDLYIGRFVASTIPFASGEFDRKVDYLIGLTKTEDTIPFLQCDGDSLTNSTYPDFLREKLNRTVIKFGFSGNKSQQIRQRFESELPTFINNSHVFWVGRNNMVDNMNSMSDIVFSDIKTMVDSLNHSRYIVMGIINGNYPAEYKGTANYNALVAFNDKLRANYGERFLDIRRYIIDNFDSGYRLSNSFIQPAVGSNVSVILNKTDGLVAGSQIIVGWKSQADIYTVISVDNSTTLTLRLDTINKVASGSTVDNESYTYGGYTATGFITVWKYQDYIDYGRDLPQSSIRVDNIHFTDQGYSLIATAVAAKVRSLNI